MLYIFSFMYVGSIPDSLCDMLSLTMLNLSSNELTGTVRFSALVTYTYK